VKKMANYDLNDDFVSGAEKRAKANETKASDDLVMLTVRVPKHLRNRLKMAATRSGTTNTAIVEEALTNWLEKANDEEENRFTAFEDDGL
jgi:predicted HicB family RNase H-like nuclease